jgi:tRNA threonylcarbamoyladenosine biosynthesis protein TsaE
MNKSFDIKHVDQLGEVAKYVSTCATQYPIIVFNGEMGAGKTTLISQVCKELHVTSPISSPTYAIVNTYERSEGDDIFHFDFYRLENEMEAVQSGLDEMIDAGNICLIEWAERIMKLLPANYVRVDISITGENSRNIEVTKV